jgi:hypothetical protein
MNWQQMHDAVAKGSFFVPLRPCTYVERLARLRWTPLFKTEPVWRWFRDDPWVVNARKHSDPFLWPYLELVLERHLLNLDTRRDPSPLLEFWEWVTDGVRCREVRMLWDGVDRELGRVPWDRARLKDIDAQERRYAAILEKRLQVLRGSAHRIAWAEDLLGRLVRSADPAGPWQEHSAARVVFAWDKAVPEELRPAIVVDLELGLQCRSAQHKYRLVTPEGPFDGQFKGVLKRVAQVVGHDNFHQLIYRGRNEFFGPGDLPRHALTGVSGGLAVYIAQRLANPVNGDGQCRALPPWVCVTAKLEDDRYGEFSLGKVAGIEKKVPVLCEAGFRAVVVADDEDQIRDVKKAGGECLRCVPCFGDAKSALSILNSSRCTRVVDLSRLKPTQERSTLQRRRWFLQGAFLAAPVGMAVGAVAGRHLIEPAPKRHSGTPAMARHDRDGMRAVARRIISGAARDPMSVLEFFQKRLGATEVTEAPGSILFDGLTVLHDSKLFDSSDWVRVPRPQDVKTRPFEPAYFTRVLKLRKDDPRRDHILIACDTGGYAVVPLPDPARPGDRVYYRANKVMAEGSGPLRTTYLSIDISKLGNDGSPFELVIRGIYFNGTQDQTHGFYRSGLRKRWDWWGSRVLPGTAHADLAIILPEQRGFRNVTYMMREDDDPRPSFPAYEVRSDDPEFEPADSVDGSYLEGNRCVWRIPCGLMARAQAELMLRDRSEAVIPKGCGVLLMPPLDDAGGIPAAGKSQVVVARVRDVLHLRVFDGDGKRVVDTDQTRLAAQARRVRALSEWSVWRLGDVSQELDRRVKLLGERVGPPGPRLELDGDEKGRVVEAVDSVVKLIPRPWIFSIQWKWKTS